MSASRKPVDLFIGGQRLPGPGQLELRNPADTRELVGRATVAATAQASDAVSAASDAFASWSDLSVHRRASALSAGIEGLRHEEESNAVLLTKEQGKILTESRREAAYPASILAKTPKWAEELAREEVRYDEKGAATITHDPLGVVVVIAPWNWPVTLLWRAVVPALLAGNTVVAKPSELTPLTATKTLTHLAEKLPPGVLNIVNGGGEIGAELVRQPQVRKITFTGSRGVGVSIFTASAATVKRLTLELGGNDAAVILDDAPLDERSISRLVKSSFMTTGQVCMAVKRIYVPRSLMDAFVEVYRKSLDSYVIGDGLNSEVSMGPVNNRAQLEKVQSLVAAAAESGAKIEVLGRYASGSNIDHGFFMRPVMVTSIDNDARLVQEEQFGPVVPIIPYDDEEDALHMANDTEFGLCGSVWTADLARGHGFARALECGYAFVNGHGIEGTFRDAPFGGIKQSGLGRENGLAGLLEYCETKVIRALS